MSTRFAINQLNPAMREQAQGKLDALQSRGVTRTHVCRDDEVTAGAVKVLGPRISEAEELLAFHLKVDGINGFVREHRFAAPRRWKFDFAFLELKLAIEVDGGAGTGGRHTRFEGFAADCEKLNEAVILGWRVLRFTTGQVKSGLAVRTIARACSTGNNNSYG